MHQKFWEYLPLDNIYYIHKKPLYTIISWKFISSFWWQQCLYFVLTSWCVQYFTKCHKKGRITNLNYFFQLHIHMIIKLVNMEHVECTLWYLQCGPSKMALLWNKVNNVLSHFLLLWRVVSLDLTMLTAWLRKVHKSLQWQKEQLQ